MVGCGLQQPPDPCPTGKVGFEPNCSDPGAGLDAPPDFSIVVSPVDAVLKPEDRVDVNLYIKHSRRFVGVVQLDHVSPGPVLVQESPNILLLPSNKSILILTVDKYAHSGTFPVTIRATGTIDGKAVERTASFSVTVNAPHASTQPTRYGYVHTDGSSQFFPASRPDSPQRERPASPAVGLDITDASGYRIGYADGHVEALEGASDFGDLRGRRLNAPIVAMEPTPWGSGYWLVGRDGGVFTFGNARFFGSTGGMRLNKPIVAMRATPTGQGYWLVASDGGVFTFGDAKFLGSTGGMRLNAPIVDLGVVTMDGYVLLAADGGVFSFGSAGFFGSSTDRSPGTAVAIESSPDGNGYWIVTAEGRIDAFGSAGPIERLDSAAAATRVVDFDASWVR